MPNLVILKLGPNLVNIRPNLKKKVSRSLRFRSEIGIIDLIIKRLCKESFEDLVINSNWKIQTVPLFPMKCRPFKNFAKLREITLLIGNTVQGAVSGLRQFLATDSPWKMMKNVFYFILKCLFVFKIFKFLYRFLVV